MVKIETKIATVSIHPKELGNVKYVTFNGKQCLLLEVNEEVVVEGFSTGGIREFLRE